MPDLGDLMWDSVRELERGLGDAVLAGDGLSAVRRRVRRGRTARHVREAAIATPVVAALVTAGWFGVDRLADADLPVASPDPTTPAPEWANDPALEGLVVGEPIGDPSLPTHHVMPDGLLDRVGPGWTLAFYQDVSHGLPRADEPPMPSIALGDHAVLLVSPGGTRFLVARIPVEEVVILDPISWDPGSGRVRVHAWGPAAGQELDAAWLDLATGRVEGDGPLTADDRAALDRAGAGYRYPEVRIERPDGDGYVSSGRFRVTSYYAYVDDDGARPAVPYGVEGRECSPVGWLDRETFLAVCMRDDYALRLDERAFDPALYAVTAATGAAEQVATIGPDDPLPALGSGTWVRDGVVAFVSSLGDDVIECGDTGVRLWDGSGFRTVVESPDRAGGFLQVRSIAGTLYVQARSCGAGADTTVTTYDADGHSVVLIPAQDDADDLSLSNWIVAE